MTAARGHTYCTRLLQRQGPHITVIYLLSLSECPVARTAAAFLWSLSVRRFLCIMYAVQFLV